MRKLDESDLPQLPKRLMTGLRRCLESGMSPAQIEASLLVMCGVHEALSTYNVEELTGRAGELVRVINGIVFLDKLKRGGKR